jgi:hypothetical protein
MTRIILSKFGQIYTYREGYPGWIDYNGNEEIQSSINHDITKLRINWNGVVIFHHRCKYPYIYFFNPLAYAPIGSYNVTEIMYENFDRKIARSF